MALGLALGIRMAAWLQGPGAGALLAGLFAVVAVVWVAARLPWRDRAALVFLCMALGAAAWALRAPPEGGDGVSLLAMEHPNRRCTLIGAVSEAPVFLPGTDSMRFLLDVSACVDGGETFPLRGRCLAYWRDPTGPLLDGTEVRVTGELRPDIGPVNFGVYGLEDMCRRKAVFSRITLRKEGLSDTGQVAGPVRHAISHFRQWQAGRLCAAVPAGVVPFVLGIWLGERSGFDRELYGQFVASGTVHVLSVSGLHVGLIYLSLSLVLGMVIPYRRLRAACVMAGVFLFALAAGAQPPTLRSALMVSAVLAYELFDREPDTLTALGLSGFVLLVLEPPGLFDLGFQLSYLSMASLLLFQEPLVRRFTLLLRGPREAVAATVGSQALSAPLAVWHFHILPVAGLAANLAVVPLLGVALWLIFATVVLAAVFPAAAVVPGYALWPVVWLTEQAVGWAASAPAGYFVLSRPTPPALLLWFAAMFLAWRLLSGDAPPTRRRWVVAAACAVAAVTLWSVRPAQPRIDFLDVGHADAACIVTPSGAVALIDGGDRKDDIELDQGRMVVAPYLRAHGLRRLDAVVATHPDSDHLGGLIHVVEQFPVKGAWLPPGGERPDALETLFLETCQRQGVPVHRVTAGTEIPLAGAKVEVLNPPATEIPGGRENDQSLVLRVGWGQGRVFFAGDIEAAAEKLLSNGDCRAELLKAPHHGSATSNSEAFLDAVRPNAVVVSTRDTGRLPALGRGVAGRYAARGLPLWRTDQHGGIRAKLCGGQLLLSGARDGRGYTLETPDDSVN